MLEGHYSLLLPFRLIDYVRPSISAPVRNQGRMLQHLRQVPLLHHLRPRLSSSLSFSARYLLILPNSYSPPTRRSFHNSSSRTIVRFPPRALCTATVEHGGEQDYFFADDGVTWKSLAISDRLAQALTVAGLHRPSLVQVSHINCSMKCSSSLPLFVYSSSLTLPNMFSLVGVTLGLANPLPVTCSIK